MRSNLTTADGAVSMLLVQYPAPPDVSGHYVPFELPEPKYQYRCFFDSYVQSGTAVVFGANSDPLAPCPAP